MSITPDDKKKWSVYILQSTVTGRYYTGVTTDVGRRLQEHNTSRRGAKATRAGRPWQIVYLEGVSSKGEALSREHQIKRMNRAAKRRLVGVPQKE